LTATHTFRSVQRPQSEFPHALMPEYTADQSSTMGSLESAYSTASAPPLYGTAIVEPVSGTALAGSPSLVALSNVGPLALSSSALFGNSICVTDVAFVTNVALLSDFLSAGGISVAVSSNAYVANVGSQCLTVSTNAGVTSQGTNWPDKATVCMLSADPYWQIVGSSTAPTRDPRNTEKTHQFRFAFQRAAKEHFEDGMSSDFTNELETLVRHTRNDTKAILLSLLEDETISSSVWAEAMRWLGRAGGLLSNSSRLSLLEKGLTSIHPAIRDGAILGLSSLDDPSAITRLERAAANEPIAQLRKDMEAVISQLKSELACFTSSK
jgi:hypothetical protein